MNSIIRLLKYFIIGFGISFIVCFCFLIFFFEIKLALLVSSIAGCMYGLFCIGFMVRTLKTVEFEINMQNKDPLKGFYWYQKELEQQMHYMLFERKLTVDGMIFYPRRLYRVFESPVEFKFDTYGINIKASRMIMRILLDVVEVNTKNKKSA